MDKVCELCGGKCRRKDNLEQQREVRKMIKDNGLLNYGTPNTCVKPENGSSKCPFD